MRNNFVTIFVFVFFGFSYIKNVCADEKEETSTQKEIQIKTDNPWEFGFGVGGLNVAHYIGANDSRKIAIPIPYVKYQGDFIKADRRGVRGVFWKNDQLEINMSFDMSLPVESKDNRARSGMPDLEFGIEFGPALDYILYDNPSKNEQLTFKWPLRAAFEVGKGSPEFYGWITSPRIQFQKEFSNWKWSSYVSVEYADQEYHAYFYDVDRAFVTDTRGFYQSKAGILDYSIGTRLSKRLGNWFFGGFVNYIDLSHSENVDSPLVKSQNNINFGAFLIRVL